VGLVTINGCLGFVIRVGTPWPRWPLRARSLPLKVGYLIKMTLTLILLEVAEAIRKKRNFDLHLQL
jgi:hypothetical protein